MEATSKLKRIGTVIFIISAVLMLIDYLDKDIYIFPITGWLLVTSKILDSLIPYGLKAKKENKNIRFFFYFLLPIAIEIILTIMLIHNYATGFLTIYRN